MNAATDKQKKYLGLLLSKACDKAGVFPYIDIQSQSFSNATSWIQFLQGFVGIEGAKKEQAPESGADHPCAQIFEDDAQERLREMMAGEISAAEPIIETEEFLELEEHQLLSEQGQEIIKSLEARK